MNAKEKQKEIIVSFLKPLLKKEGYNTVGLTWWKINGAFFNVINLQNFSWNTKESVDFTFNFSTGLVSTLKDSKKITINDGITYIRESYFPKISKSKYHNGNNGYHIDT